MSTLRTCLTSIQHIGILQQAEKQSYLLEANENSERGFVDNDGK